MNQKNEVPYKFIAINLFAASLLILWLIYNDTGSFEGLIVIGAVGIFVLLIIASLILLSKLLDNGPKSLQAMLLGFRQFILYLWFAWLGWKTHEFYLESPDKKFATWFVFAAVVLACILTISLKYKRNLKDIKNEKIS